MMVSPQISGDIESAVVDSHAVLSPAPLCGMPTETSHCSATFPMGQCGIEKYQVRYKFMVYNVYSIYIYMYIYIYYYYIYCIYIYHIYIERVIPK
jgi:hypothetical protein